MNNPKQRENNGRQKPGPRGARERDQRPEATHGGESFVFKYVLQLQAAGGSDAGTIPELRARFLSGDWS